MRIAHLDRYFFSFFFTISIFFILQLIYCYSFFIVSASELVFIENFERFSPKDFLLALRIYFEKSAAYSEIENNEKLRLNLNAMAPSLSSLNYKLFKDDFGVLISNELFWRAGEEERRRKSFFFKKNIDFFNLFFFFLFHFFKNTKRSIPRFINGK